MRKEVYRLVIGCPMVALLLAATPSPHRASGTDDVARRILDTAHAGQCHVTYWEFAQHGLHLELASVEATPSASIVFVYASDHGHRRHLVWSRRNDGDIVSSVQPWRDYGGDAKGFVVVTKRATGRGYRVIVVLATASGARGHVALNELGYGPPYGPEYADITGSGYCVVILPWMDDYPKHPPSRARVFLFDPKTERFKKRVVPWRERFSSSPTSR
jgi:hypothetical protein